VLTVFFTVAYQAYVPSLVERDRLVEANARFEATETLARLAGPGFNRTIVWGVSPLGALLGGGLAASAGLRIAILVGAAIAFAAAIPALASPLRSLRRLPEPASLAS
jgi:hypothetical protein